MFNYVKKFTMEILPSVAATIIGAYIVNHYIVAKPAADAPVAAAASVADPKAAPGAKPAETSADAGNLPAAGVKAKGMSERTLLERSASEKAVVTEKPQEKSQEKSDAKSTDAKPSDTPVETASIPAEPRRHTPAPREKVRVVLPSPVQPSAAAPVTAVPAPAPPVEAAVAPEERRDANDLARAAIERLRGNGDSSPRPQEAARTPEAPRTTETSRTSETPRVVTAPAVRPLPPPIMVSAPPNNEAFDQGSQARPSYPVNAGNGDQGRPTPPADIPASRPPLDLRADAEPTPPREHKSVAEDVLSAAKSVFHAVLPK
jgi:hypothetical protein